MGSQILCSQDTRTLENRWIFYLQLYTKCTQIGGGDVAGPILCTKFLNFRVVRDKLGS